MTTATVEETPVEKPALEIDRGSFAGWLIGNSSQLVSKLAKKNLNNFLAKALQLNGMTGKSTEKPITFTSEKEFRVSLQKLNKRFLVKAAEKDPVILKEEPYIQKLFSTSEDSGKVLISLVNDPVTIRYLKYIQHHLNKKKIPMEFLRVTQDAFTVTYSFQYRNRAGSSPMNLYRLGFYIPNILKVITTLQRKALYADTKLIEYSPHGVAGFNGSQFTGSD